MNKSIESINSRPAQAGMVGDGFRVYNFIPGHAISQQRISPFLLLDFAAEYNFAPSEIQRGVDVHPHNGFEMVTIAYKGSIAHHDSTGNCGIIHPGDVQWMTAGAGILPKEYHEKNYSEKGGPFEMIQLWVNLPAKYKSTAPHYQAITADKMGKLFLSDNSGIVNVIAGELESVKGPAATYTPVHFSDIRLNKEGIFKTSLPATYNTALLVIRGSVEVNEKTAAEHNFVLFANDGEHITIKAKVNAILLLLSGEPIAEPIASYGPFVMNTRQEINEALEEYRSGKFGVLN